ncbi:MAG: flagellin lysine-N-methylase [Clostridia bacterium]|nr:flagellin lysine-N-methylase [Clostridia bacterium]
MKLFAPRYYNVFKCIADRCTHSCCIGWEIDVDPMALEKYDSLCHGYGDVIRESIERGDCPHFRLTDDDRCPHLDSRGLCRIITELGEDFLCDICREHPRFYNFTKEGAEVGLGLSCEEAARIILSSDGYGEFTEVGELTDADGAPFFDGCEIRDEVYSVLRDESISYDGRLSRIYGIMGVSPFEKGREEWVALLSSLEYLENRHKDLFCAFELVKNTPRELEKPLERALAYFVYRHVTAAQDEDEARAELGLSLFLERLLCSLAKNSPEADIAELARIVSEELEYSEDNTEALKDEFYIYDL